MMDEQKRGPKGSFCLVYSGIALLLLFSAAIVTSKEVRGNESWPGRAEIEAEKHADPPESGADSARDRVLICVKDICGDPIEGAKVIGPDEVTVETDSKGRAFLASFPKLLKVVHPWYAPWISTYAKGKKDKGLSKIDVTLKICAQLRCKVCDINGRPLSGARLDVSLGSVSEIEGKPWFASLNAGKSLPMVYHRSVTTDKKGNVNLTGLSLGRHEIICSLMGYIDAENRGVSLGRTLELIPGENNLEIVLKEAYVQAFVLTNRTDLPYRIFRGSVMSSVSYPKGLTDVHPFLRKSLVPVREHVLSLTEQGCSNKSCEFIQFAYNKDSVKVVSFAKANVMVGFLYGGLQKFTLPWISAKDFRREDIKFIDIKGSESVCLAGLRVSSPYKVDVHPVNKEGRITRLTFGFNPSKQPGIEKEFPEGEYYIEPSSAMLWRGGRDKRIRIKKGKNMSLDFWRDAIPMSRLKVRVKDSSGLNPAWDTRISIDCLSGRAKLQHTSICLSKRFRPAGVIDMVCELGTYRITVYKSKHLRLWSKKVTVTEGKDTVVDYVMKY